MSELGLERHKSRERALEILYEAAIKERSVGEIIGALSISLDPYCEMLVRSAEEHRREAEDLIGENSQEWTIDRMALVDRLIMTMAIGELMLPEPPPRAVVLDESVELAKVYSTDGSASFVNGVLAACVAQLEH